MLKILLAGIISLSISFFAHADHAKTEPSDGTVASFIKVTPARYLEPVDFYNIHDEKLNFSHLKGKVLMVNLWATWCGPCLRELPALQRLSNKFQGTDFELLAISIDREKTPAEILKFYQDLNIDKLGFYWDKDQQLNKILPVDVVPASFIINRKGEVISYMRSFADWDVSAATEMILSHLGEFPYQRPQLLKPTMTD
jgi:thiol-disulfide isomerase/thioredoxin